MDAAEFQNLVAGCDQQHLANYLQISPATFRRYLAGHSRIPHAVVIALRIKLDGDLSAIGGTDWQDFRIDTKDRKLYMPLFRRGFTPWQLKAMFFTTQDAWADKRDLDALKKINSTLLAELDESKKRADFLRAQLRKAQQHIF